MNAGRPAFRAGLAIAEQAYGAAIVRCLHAALDAFQRNRARASACIQSLAVEDTPTLRKGLRALRAATDPAR